MTDLTGRTLGRYRLEALLGRGGMAEVWRATDTKLARTVAVKVIHAAHAEDPNFVERFLREARVVASLEHPHVLPVYDFGEEAGLPFLVMPYLPGGTLRDRLRGTRAPLGVAAAWIRELGDALDAAHGAGILHRDVKPANVLVGKGDRLFLADFGIAKMLETMSGLTATGVVVGTPTYMAPEQAKGEPASPATDRYALACVAYEILTGKPPFEGDNPLSLMHQHVSTPAPALSTKAAGLPAGLDDVFARALSKDPAERPPTCRALGDAVAAFVPPGQTGGPWTPVPSETAPTVMQSRGATPTPVAKGTVPWPPPPARPATPTPAPHASPPVRVETPAASLTSDATVLTTGRRKRRVFLWVAGAAIVIAGFGLLLKGKREERERGTASKVSERSELNGAPSGASASGTTGAPPPPSTDSAGPRPPFGANSSSPSSVSIPAFPTPPPYDAAIAADEKRIAALEKRVKDAEAAAQAARDGAARGPAHAGVPPVPAATGGPPVPPVPQTQEDESAPSPVRAALTSARERLDITKKPDHRIARDDFQYALDTARQVLAGHPKNPEARSLEAYAAGGLAYAAGHDVEAGRQAVEAVLVLKRAGKQDHRPLAQLVSRPDGSIVAPKGWELAVAYGDARGEAMSLLDAALHDDPRDVRARRARAVLRHVQGLEPEGGEGRGAGHRRQ